MCVHSTVILNLFFFIYRFTKKYFHLRFFLIVLLRIDFWQIQSKKCIVCKKGITLNAKQ